jgi:hypothetical protein
VIAAGSAVSFYRPEISPIPRLITALVTQRVGAEAGRQMQAAGYPPAWRMAALVQAGLLALGTLTLAGGGKGAAWAFGLSAAGLAALASVGGVCLGCQIHARRSGRR